MSNFSKKDLESLINELMGRDLNSTLPVLIQKHIRELIVDYRLSLSDIGKILAYMCDIEGFVINELYGIKQLIYRKDAAFAYYKQLKEEHQRQIEEAKRIQEAEKVIDNNIIFKIKTKKNKRKIIQIPLEDIEIEEDE